MLDYFLFNTTKLLIPVVFCFLFEFTFIFSICTENMYTVSIYAIVIIHKLINTYTNSLLVESFNYIINI